MRKLVFQLHRIAGLLAVVYEAAADLRPSVLYGADAAGFLQPIKQLLEPPLAMSL